MTRTALLAAAATLLAAPALAQTLAPPAYRVPADDITTGSLRPAPQRDPIYQPNGNARNPAETLTPGLPAWQQGSGTETGGPARELIPSRF